MEAWRRTRKAHSARCTALCPAHEKRAGGGAGPQEGRARACLEEDRAGTLWA